MRQEIMHYLLRQTFKEGLFDELIDVICTFFCYFCNNYVASCESILFLLMDNKLCTN